MGTKFNIKYVIYYLGIGIFYNADSIAVLRFYCLHDTCVGVDNINEK